MARAGRKRKDVLRRVGRVDWRAMAEDPSLLTKWNKARDEFRKVLGINATDKAASLYVERCDLLGANPPADDWTGVWVMTHK